MRCPNAHPRFCVLFVWGGGGLLCGFFCLCCFVLVLLGFCLIIFVSSCCWQVLVILVGWVECGVFCLFLVLWGHRGWLFFGCFFLLLDIHT